MALIVKIIRVLLKNKALYRIKLDISNNSFDI